MCGIAGFNLSPTDNPNVNSKRLARNLLLGIEHRGHDASGFAFLDPTGSLQAHKQPLAASDFVKRHLCIPKRTPRAVLHTRAATKGDPENNANNHPILTGGLVGVHNGYLSNDEDLWGKVVKAERRQGLVDSEVIFAMLAHGRTDSPGMTWLDALEEVHGRMAVAWLDVEYPDHLFLARGDGSPLFIGQTEGGSIIFASEDDIVANAAKEVGLTLTKLLEAQEGQLFITRDGDIYDSRTFKPSGYRYYETNKNGSGRGFGWSSWEDDLYDYDDDIFGTGTKSARQSASVFVRNQASTPPADDGLDESDVDGVYVDSAWVDRRAFQPLEVIQGSVKDTYFSFFTKREEAIDTWLAGLKCSADQLSKLCQDLKAFVTPGDYCSTKLGGQEYPAQVIGVPDSFPGGLYMLRVFMNRATRRGSTDVVLVERHASEFTITKAQRGPRPRAALTAAT